MATLAQARSATQEILNDLATSSIYSPEYIDQCINDTETDMCDTAKFNFLKDKELYNAPADTSLTGDVTTVSTVLPVNDTTNYPTSGAVYIEQDIILYTGKTSTTLTGCTGIGINHSSGQVVRPVLALPSNYAKRPVLEVYKGGNSKPLTYEYIDETDYFHSRLLYKFTFVSDGSGNRYLMANALNSTDSMVFKYLKKPTTLVDDSDVLTIPDPYALKIVPIFAAARCQMLRGDNLDGEAVNKFEMAQRELFQMQKHFGEQEQGVRKVIRSSYGSRRTDFFYSKRILN